MYFKELCSTLFLLAVPVLVPLYMVRQKKTSLTEVYGPAGDGFIPLWINFRKGCGSCWRLPMPPSLLSSSAGWVQHVPADLCPAPGHSAPQLGARSSHDLIPPINCTNTSSPIKGTMQTMCFLHWRIEKEAVSESLIIFANKIEQRVWVSLLSKCYLPLTEEDEFC